MKKPNILLIGCGPHAKRVYLPILKESKLEFGTQLKAIVELKEKKAEVSQYIENLFDNVDDIYVDKFGKEYVHTLPEEVEKQLNQVVKDKKINGVIIATDPLNHMQYALWAQKQNLNILMDKPISTYENISNSIEQARQLTEDYKLLMKNHNPDKVFIINAQRRFLPQFEIVQGFVNEIAEKYSLDKSKVMNELARQDAVKEFLEVIVGKRAVNETKGNIVDHDLSVQLMSMIYESGICNSEIVQSLNKKF